MRRWLTVGLALVAGAAAIVAPRLLPAIETTPMPQVRPVGADPTNIAELTATTAIAELAAPVVSLPPEPVIPEVLEAPQPAPVPETFWDDCPVCGMG